MRLHVCSIALSLSFASLSVTAAPPLLVKEHSDLSRLLVEGNETFTADQIRDELERNLELLALRRRLAPYREFEGALGRLIRDGYLQAGFADVAVDVAFDEERRAMVATIDEGKRYECGDVQVTGVPDDRATLIRRRLTRPYLPADEVVAGVHDEATGELLYGINADGKPAGETPAIWEPGKPAGFHDRVARDLREAVAQVMRDAGFQGVEVSVELVRSTERKVAALHVDVTDAGEPIVIDEVVVTGAKRNSTESVLAYLGLQTPIQWTPALRQRLNQKLWDCGRFQSFSVKIGSPEEEMAGAPTRLHVDLLEYDGIPRLTEELNEVDRILCRAAHWLNSEAGRTSDLVIDVHGAASLHVWAVVSATGGVVLELEQTAPGDARPRSAIVALEPDRRFALSGMTGQCFEYRFDQPLRVKLCLAMLGIPDPENERHVSLRFGLGFSSASRVATRLQFAAAPMALLYHARMEESECTIADGILSIRSKVMAAEFEAATGRWIRIAVLDGKHKRSSAEIRFEEQGFDRAMRRWRERVDGQTVVTSLPDIIADELISVISGTGAAGAESLITLTAFSTDLSERLENRFDRTRRASQAESFYIPWMPDEPPAIPMDMVGIVLTGNRLLFPRDSSFGTFGRELLLAYVMRDRQATGNIKRLMESYSTGPLMYWYAAEAFRFLNPVVAQAIAREGQNRLDRRRFESDCRQLLTRDDIVRDVIEDCVASLRELDDSQLAALFAPVVPPEQRTAMIAALRRDGSSDLDVLLSLLGELWDAKLQDLLRQRLTTLSGGPRIQNANREPAARDAIRSTALAP